jgi:ATP-dependent helicase/nuclease subunit B
LELEPAECDRMLGEVIAALLPSDDERSVAAALREVDRRLVVQWLSAYRAQCEKYAGLWQDFEQTMRPELFEVSFGRGDEPPPSTDRPLEFAGEGQTVRISGRIDRIDTGRVAGANVFNVLDYKTGRSIAFSPETIRAGLTLQLPLYTFALMELLLPERDLIPWQAGYWYVREDGFPPRRALKMYRNDEGRIELEPQWESVRDELGEIVAGLVRGIRRGHFPVCSADEHCTGRCPMSTVCRINQVRSLEKTCQPTQGQ